VYNGGDLKALLAWSLLITEETIGIERSAKFSLWPAAVDLRIDFEQLKIPVAFPILTVKIRGELSYTPSQQLRASVHIGFR
jgi:hypothetical protein